MKHTIESLKKAAGKLHAAMDRYNELPFYKLHLHISKGNKKIGRVHNFSMAPGITCPNCKGCLPYCYDVKAVLQYGNVVNARAENTVMMYKDMTQTFSMIDDYITKCRTHKFFRWHVSGDIISVEYFDNMVRIARKHPDWVFWTYTKAYAFVNLWIYQHGKSALPENLSVMFSVWNGMECPNPHGMPTFTCIQAGMTPAPGEWRCPGNCDICLTTGHGCPYGESSNVDEH